MQFIHYTNEEFELMPNDYDQSKARWNAKPRGLWFSVQGPYDWKWWCESERFNLQNFEISYEITFKENAKILCLDTEKDIFEMTIKYPSSSVSWDGSPSSYELNWKQIKEEYQGIVIPQYFWGCRMALESCWYYGWDCASGCVWDLDCIEEIKLLEKNEKVEMLP